jgi:hypothetical protein
MQNPYEIDIQREIPNSQIEPEISYRFTKISNKRYKITDNPYKKVPFCNYQLNSNLLKRKFIDISTELPEVMVCGKCKFNKNF